MHDPMTQFQSEARWANKAMEATCSTRDLSVMPEISFGFVESYVRRHVASLGEKNLNKGFKYFSEQYVHNIKLFSTIEGCRITAGCHRSMKKSESPHTMEIYLQNIPLDVTFAKCTCPIGLSKSCGHVTATLYQLAHYSSLKLSAVPTDIVKTSMRQTWHEPRGQKIRGAEVSCLEFRGYNRLDPKKETSTIKSTLSNPVRTKLPSIVDIKDKLRDEHADFLLLSVIPDITLPSVPTKYGSKIKGSVISYQQKQHSDYILNLYDTEDFPSLPCNDHMVNVYAAVMDKEKSAKLGTLAVSKEEASVIEEETRLQSTDPKWHNVRRERITASKAGEVITRRKDFEKLAERWKSGRTVVTSAMKHGIASECLAAQAYVDKLDQNVNLYPCGIVVSPTASWLAASPDRKVYRPNRTPPFGLLEIKCPVTGSVLELDYLKKNEAGILLLKKRHNYYRQVVMQLACTGLEWCDFFVWTENDSHLETIYFDQVEWQEMKDKLDMFFFNYLL